MCRGNANTKTLVNGLRIVSNTHRSGIHPNRHNFHDTVRFSLRDLEKEYEKTEEDIKAVQSVGQIIGEVLKQLDDERCMPFFPHFPAETKQFGSYCQGIFRPSLCCIV